MAVVVDYIPEAEDLLSMEVEELGLVLLKVIQKRGEPKTNAEQVQGAVWKSDHAGYPRHLRREVTRAVVEAWQWLLNEGLLMVDIDQPNGWFCLTRKGAKLKTDKDLEAYRHGNLLPVGLLHPSLVEKVRPMFLRGDYDVAVFQAFKDVEVAVRAASGLKDMLGVKLMRAAFGAENGPLTDKESDAGERVARMELYAGAIGHCKNPTSHREVVVERAEAARLIALASHLLTELDGR